MVSAARASSRILMMPGITVDMMERLVAVDYTALDGFTRKVIAALRGGAEHPRHQCRRHGYLLQRQGPPLGQQQRRHRPARGARQPAGRRMLHLPGRGIVHRGRIVIRLIDDKLGRGGLDFEKGRLVKWSGRGVEAIGPPHR